MCTWHTTHCVHWCLSTAALFALPALSAAVQQGTDQKRCAQHNGSSQWRSHTRQVSVSTLRNTLHGPVCMLLLQRPGFNSGRAATAAPEVGGSCVTHNQPHNKTDIACSLVSSAPKLTRPQKGWRGGWGYNNNL